MVSGTSHFYPFFSVNVFWHEYFDLCLASQAQAKSRERRAIYNKSEYVNEPCLEFFETFNGLLHFGKCRESVLKMRMDDSDFTNHLSLAGAEA